VNLAVFSHKICWPSGASPSGYATDGGFPFQMNAISQIFDRTSVIVPVRESAGKSASQPLAGHNLRIVPLSVPAGKGLRRKLSILPWLARNAPVLLREIRRADAVHAPIPGDIGTFGMVAAFLLRKPLFVRHCGNWLQPRTSAEHFWRWFMERFAGGQNIMLATGGAKEKPSATNANVEWIFSSSLWRSDLESSRPRKRSSTDPVRLTIVCRQEKLKGTGQVIRSLPLILQSFPGTRLDVVGEGYDLDSFKALAAEIGVADSVTFHGGLAHQGVLDVLATSTLFCYPTAASEGFPKVVLEALGSGLPVVTTRVSVLPALLASGCGVLLDETTPDAIARGVRECLDPARYAVMSRQALQTAGRYSLEDWRDRIAERLRGAWGPLRAA
jgi:glycosyltransferase involved in cell wall biosynthesis